MNDSGSHIINIPSANIKITTYAPTVTIGPTEIKGAVEKSELSLTEKTILITIVAKYSDKGVTAIEDIIAHVYSALKDNTELFTKFVELIQSIGQ